MNINNSVILIKWASHKIPVNPEAQTSHFPFFFMNFYSDINLMKKSLIVPFAYTSQENGYFIIIILYIL